MHLVYFLLCYCMLNYYLFYVDYDATKNHIVLLLCLSIYDGLYFPFVTRLGSDGIMYSLAFSIQYFRGPYTEGYPI